MSERGVGPPIIHPARATFNPKDWYWHFTGGKHRLDVPGEPVFDLVYSSARGTSVSVDDPNYLAWVAAESVDRTTQIDTEDHLLQVLSLYGLEYNSPPPAVAPTPEPALEPEPEPETHATELEPEVEHSADPAPTEQPIDPVLTWVHGGSRA